MGKKNIKNKTENKVSYNPFKMWGSWVGAVIYAAIILIVNSPLNYLIKPVLLLIESFIKKLPQCNLLWNCIGLVIILIIIASFILGFLIGWFIHSLCRYLRNKKIRGKK